MPSSSRQMVERSTSARTARRVALSPLMARRSRSGEEANCGDRSSPYASTVATTCENPAICWSTVPTVSASEKSYRALRAQRGAIVAKRRSRPAVLARLRDRTELSSALVGRLGTAALPFDFMHALYLETLGIARTGQGDQLFLDRNALATYQPPPDATDGFVLRVGAHRRVEPNPQGTRLDPLAASALWSARVEMETGCVVTPHAWCTSCGRHFLDQRRGPPRIARWCADCRASRLRHIPPLRRCAAADCAMWFRPQRSNQAFHSGACRVADQRAAGATRAARTG